MGRRTRGGRVKVLIAVRSFLARISGLLQPGQRKSDVHGYESWEDAEHAYLEVNLLGLGIGDVDISVAGDKVFVRISIDPPP